MHARDDTSIQNVRLLSSVAEQLRLLLLQIARSSELAAVQNGASEHLALLQQNSQIGLSLVEHYLLGLKYHEKQAQLTLEPVPLAALLYDVREELLPVAKSYKTDIELVVAGKYPPVMANRELLKAAVVSLGYGMITGQTTEEKTRPIIRLAAHQTPLGVVTGVYGESAISTDMLKIGRDLYGKARQPITSLAPAGSAGIFVADSLFTAMATNLRGSKFQGKRGLAATFHKSSQLLLV